MLRIEYIINQMLENLNEAEMKATKENVTNLDKLLPVII